MSIFDVWTVKVSRSPVALAGYAPSMANDTIISATLKCGSGKVDTTAWDVTRPR